ncbi:MAG: NAD(P)/FAD-dependent oxidoreductase [Candidatus Aminicenantes bacterium]|nr:NAD(P)/FAD-dependent oxidoreductase [Candidatus Aminicenantes bacterium]
MKKNKEIADLTVVGGGPAGMTAALEASRLGLKVILIEKNELGGSLQLARKVANFPPWPPVAGSFLVEVFKKRIFSAGIKVLKDQVLRLKSPDHPQKCYHLMLKKFGQLRSRTVILATGQEFFLPEGLNFKREAYFFPGELDLYRLKKGSKVAIVGGGEVALDQALLYADWGAEVVVFSRSSLKANPELLKEVESSQVRIRLNAVLFSARQRKASGVDVEWISASDEQRNEEFDYLVVACGKRPSLPVISGRSVFELPRSEDYPGVATQLPGLYVAGDLKNGRQRYVSLAVADGLLAAYEAFQFIENMRKRGEL